MTIKKLRDLDVLKFGAFHKVVNDLLCEKGCIGDKS